MQRSSDGGTGEPVALGVEWEAALAQRWGEVGAQIGGVGGWGLLVAPYGCSGGSGEWRIAGSASTAGGTGAASVG